MLNEELAETILIELRALRAEVAVLTRGACAARPPSGDELVDVHYVAGLFGCSVYSAQTGKAGTSHVRWTSRRPLRCARAEAHAALRRYTESKQHRPRLIKRKAA